MNILTMRAAARRARHSKANYCRPGTALFRGAFLSLAAFCATFAPLAADDADDLDSLFDDPGALEIIEASPAETTASGSAGTAGSAVASAPVAAAPTDTAFFRWAGDYAGTVGVNANYGDILPFGKELLDPDESLELDATARVWFDAQPDRHYRVFGKFVADYPYGEDYTVLDVTGAPRTLSVASVSVFELFTEFNWDDRVFFRFGKQTAGWGLSRFYQIADPLSVGVKDPADPTADLEGPLALRIAVPMDVHNLYFYAVLKDSYLPDDSSDASVTNAGLGVKGDFLVRVPKNPVFSNGELTLGGYYQKDLAPKAVAGYSTGIGKVQVFTDQVVSWGLDSARLTESEEFYDGSGVYGTDKPDWGLFWGATLGALYVNNDWHFTGYAEYLYNGAGTDDPHYIEKWIARYGAETVTGSTLDATLVATDLFGYLGRHNSALSLSWSELFGNDKLSASVLWLQNWVDFSGMASPSVTISPFDHFAIVAGISVIWGRDETEWAIKNADLSDYANGDLAYRHLIAKLAVKLGGGKF